MAAGLTLYTIGHGAGTFDAFVEQLQAAGIRRVVDVRRFPGSHRHPHFGREALEAALTAQGIAYEWSPDLGGRRRPTPGSPNVALRNDAFRAYADYMATPEFAAAAEALLASAAADQASILCSETLWWRCHRRLIADWATARGASVLHLIGGKATPHVPTAGLRALTLPLRYDVV